MKAKPAPAAATSHADDDQDDPNQIDTIVLGDPADAPVPRHHGDHVSPVHPTIVIVLPRSDKQTGMIPDTAAGHLLYDWLAAFNQSSASGLASALPNAVPGFSTAAQLTLRQQTGGFQSALRQGGSARAPRIPSCATRPRRASKLSAPSRCVLIPARPPSATSASAPCLLLHLPRKNPVEGAGASPISDQESRSVYPGQSVTC